MGTQGNEGEARETTVRAEAVRARAAAAVDRLATLLMMAVLGRCMQGGRGGGFVAREDQFRSKPWRGLRVKVRGHTKVGRISQQKYQEKPTH